MRGRHGRRGRGRKHARRGRQSKRAADHALLSKRVASRLLEMVQDEPLKYLAFSNSGLAGYNSHSYSHTTGYAYYGAEVVSSYLQRLVGGVYTGAVQTRAGDKVHVTGIHGKVRVVFSSAAVQINRWRMLLVYIKPSKITQAGGITSPTTLITAMFGVATPQWHQMEDYLNGNTRSANGIRILAKKEIHMTPQVSTDAQDMFVPVNFKFKKPLLFDFSNTNGTDSNVGELWMLYTCNQSGVCTTVGEFKIYFRDQQ